MMAAPPKPPAPAAGLTPEQAAAVERRSGDLLLAAGAGSGKTKVLTERFVRAVLDDDVDPARILAVTFTEKAASELAERIRGALVAAERPELARRADEGWIGTLHSLCARILRSHPLAAGLDPRFVVLDEVVAARLASESWDTALAGWVREHCGRADALLAAYGAWGLRQAMTGAHDQLRSRGVPVELPAPPPVPDVAAAGRMMRAALDNARAAIAAAECPVPAEAGPALVRCGEELDALEASAWTALPAPLALEALLLPRNGGKVMKEEPCLHYREALEALTQACLDARAVGDLPFLDDLLLRFAGAYATAKGDHGGLDFADLELGGRDLLRARADLRAGYREQFASIMVDEFQDTNHVQLDLLELLADDNLFTVGDAQQAIYGFRHADVEIFRARRATLGERGAALRLSVSFRATPALLRAVNAAFAEELEDFEPLRPPDGTDPASPDDEPSVELLLADLAQEWPAEQVAPAGTPPTAATWRVAEARLLARRVAELVAQGRRRNEIVVLLRATGDLSTYSGALEDEGGATYVIGGRGVWAQHEVQDMVAWLSVVANPRDELRLYEVMASPLVGASADALAALAAAARQARRDPWSVLVEDDGAEPPSGADTAPGRAPTAHLEDPALDAPTPPPGPSPLSLLDPAERETLARFAAWAGAERAGAPHRSLEALVERALVRAGYDLRILRAPGGPRRLANVRKLMRLAREWEADAGRDLRGFLDLVAERVGEDAAEAREGEAPVEGEGLDAVRLMTIHRAKGLEFPVVCVADLGRRRPNRESEMLRLGDDGRRVGVRIAVPGGGRARPALAYAELGEELREREQAEERRLFYVAATRAREHLVLSGAVNAGRWPANGAAVAPVSWLGPAFVPGLPARLEAGDRSGEAAETGASWRIVGP